MGPGIPEYACNLPQIISCGPRCLYAFSLYCGQVMDALAMMLQLTGE
jgi:hypothetical protein